MSVGSISNWKKTLNHATIQDSEGNLIFSVDGNTYTLNVNSEEERAYILARINSISEHTWNWFKEKTGEEHWVLYNTEMYESAYDDDYLNNPDILVELFGTTLPPFYKNHLYYKENSNLVPIIPINATSCFYMFYNCNSLTSLNLTNFDTSKVVDMSGMFSKCSKLTSLDLTNFNTSKVTDMSCMFEECHSLTILDLSSFNTSKVINMHSMFNRCDSLTSLYLSNFDTSKVTKMSWMFYGCSSLITLDITNFDISRVTKMKNMFFFCNSLKTVKASDTKLIKHIRNDYPQIQIEYQLRK